MKQVIRVGKIYNTIKYKYKCKNCKTLFTFEDEDLRFHINALQTVNCPYCNYINKVVFLRKYKEKK